MNKPTVPEVLPLVQALYATEHGQMGGHLHIVLDDQNVDTDHVEYCLKAARFDQCKQCEELAELLMRMSPTQRKKLSLRAYSNRIIRLK
jgi:hypothetical protein